MLPSLTFAAWTHWARQYPEAAAALINLALHPQIQHDTIGRTYSTMLRDALTKYQPPDPHQQPHRIDTTA